MERIEISEREEIKLQRLAFNALLIRDVTNRDMTVIRLIRHGTETRILGTVKRDHIIALRIRVVERLDLRLVRRIGIFRVVSVQQGQRRMRQCFLPRRRLHLFLFHDSHSKILEKND